MGIVPTICFKNWLTVIRLESRIRQISRLSAKLLNPLLPLLNHILVFILIKLRLDLSWLFHPLNRGSSSLPLTRCARFNFLFNWLFMEIQSIFDLVGCWPGPLKMVLPHLLQHFLLIGFTQLLSILRPVMTRIFVIALTIVYATHL